MVSFFAVDNNRVILNLRSVVTIAVLWLTACGSARVPLITEEILLPSETPTVILPQPTYMLQTTVDSAPQAESGGNLVDSPGPIALTDTQPTPTALSIASIPTEEPTAIPTTPSVLRHTVQRGETLLGLAMEFGVSMAAIQLTNAMGDSIDLTAGDNLSIPGSTQWPGESRFWVVHVVQTGETLVGLSSAYGLTMDDILRVNAIADPSLIHAGQYLVVPVAQLMLATAPRATSTPGHTTVAASVGAASVVADVQASPAPGPSETLPDSTSTPTQPPPAATPTAAAPPPALPPAPTDWSAYILARINQVRAEHGLNTLTQVPELNLAAQAHAEDCAQRGWGSHVGSDGAVLKTRLERAGYFGRNQGENWVQAQNAETAFDWWYGEIPPNDAHKRNILSPYYTEIGIGIAKIRRGFIFVTDFGRR